MKLKKIALGALAGSVLLAGCKSTMFIDPTRKNYKTIETLTQEVPKEDLQKTELKYQIGRFPLSNKTVFLKVDLTKKVTNLEEYYLITSIKREVLVGKVLRSWNGEEKVLDYIPTGKTEVKNTSTELKSRILYKNISNEPAKFIYITASSSNPKVCFEDGSKTPKQSLKKYTDENGKVEFKLVSTTNDWEFVIDDPNFNTNSLLDKVKEHWSVRGIKEPYRSKLLIPIKNLIKNSKETTFIHLGTNERRTSENQKIINDGILFGLRGNCIDYNEIFPIIKEFIDDKVNSKIKDIGLTVRDIDSHVGLAGSKLEMEIEAPSKEDLADDYFTGKLLSWATSQVKDYERGNTVAYTNSKGNAKLSIFIPSEFKIEVTHPNYYYTKGKKKFDSNKGFDIDMIEKGSKIRIDKNKGSKNGIITEK